jgi:hypothetical protein
MTSEAPTLVERLQDEADLCRNEGVDCDVVQLVRHSDALAAIQRLEAENKELRYALQIARQQIVGDRDLFIAYSKNPMLIDLLDENLRNAGPGSCDSALVIIDAAMTKEQP